MTLCMSNSGADNSVQNPIQKAWMAKMKQTIAKVQVSMPNDKDAQMLIWQYNQMIEEGNSKSKNIFKWMGIILGGLFLFGLILAGLIQIFH